MHKATGPALLSGLALVAVPMPHGLTLRRGQCGLLQLRSLSLNQVAERKVPETAENTHGDKTLGSSPLDVAVGSPSDGRDSRSYEAGRLEQITWHL